MTCDIPQNSYLTSIKYDLFSFFLGTEYNDLFGFRSKSRRPVQNSKGDLDKQHSGTVPATATPPLLENVLVLMKARDHVPGFSESLVGFCILITARVPRGDQHRRASGPIRTRHTEAVG